ncbi:TPA: hypothetical protein EYP70_05550 [Candidatus Bathyarchaeota archaeon]|nr:hypothetical protein [Candidatus Bathyarchaeota archaeon]
MAKRQSILLTTSRRPTKDMRTFCRDLSYTFPNIVRITRGKLSLDGLMEKALESHANKIIVVDRWKGGSGKIRFLNLNSDGLRVVPPIVYLRDLKFRRNFRENMPKGRRIRSIAVVSSSQEKIETEKLERTLSGFFEIPLFSINEVVKRRYDAVMQISQEIANRIKITFKLLPEQVEIGPRIIVSHLVWESTL